MINLTTCYPGRADRWPPLYPVVMAPFLLGVWYAAQNPCDTFFERKRLFFLEIRHCHFHHMIYCISQEALQLDYLSAMGPLMPFVVSSSQGKGYYRQRFRVCSMDVMFENASNQNLAPQIIVGSTAVFGDDNCCPHFVCIVCIYHHPGIERRLHLPVPPLGCVRGEPTSRTR